WDSLGCYTDVVCSRTLNYEQYGLPSMTVEICLAACQSAGYILAGVEYNGECYCDNIFENGGGPAPDGDTGCNMACAGDSFEICGGPDRLNVY
ncbi:carbohydrate-binding WSC, partial [Glonium stellatum]